MLHSLLEMSKGKIKAIRLIPGSTSLKPILRDFCRQEGIVTAFSDSALPIIRRFVEEGDPVEVKPFGEVVRNFLTLCGEEALPIAQAGHLEAAIAQAADELPDDSPFLSAARFPGFHQAVARTLKELHEWDVDAYEMRALSQTASPRLAAKLRSLAQIDDASRETLYALGRQLHPAQVRACLDAMPERDGSLERLFVFVGAEECPLRLQWLQWVSRMGTDVTVIFERHATDAPIFPGARRAEARLGEPAASVGDGNRLLRNLFSPTANGGPGIEVAIVSAADPLAEAEWALRGCLEEERPDLAGIYVRNLETYAPLIEAAAKRLGIEVRIARRAPLLTNAFARLTLTALEFCASNDVRKLNPILRSSYLGLTGDRQRELGSALREAHSTRSMQWETLYTWAELHRDAFPWVSVLLNWRLRAAGSLPLAEWMPLLRELIDPKDTLPWGTRVGAADHAMRERDGRARHQLERLLANFISVDSVTRQRSMNLAEVTRLCRRLWKDSDVSIPPCEYGVCVVDDPYSLPEIKTLHVLGMLEGVFPRRRSEEPILTDFEREEISSLRPDKARLLTSHDRAEAERDAFYRVCAAGDRRVVFSYPMADDQRDNIPAFYLTEIERAMNDPGAEPKDRRVSRRDIPRTLLAPALEACLSEGDLRLRTSLESPRELPSLVEWVTAEARDALRPEPDHRFGPNELRDALQCPFQYVLRHRLRLRVRRPAARWQSLRKLPQAAGLLSKATYQEAEQALIVALDAELDALYSDVPEWEMQLLRAGGRRLIKDWMRREFRSRETWPKEAGSVRGNVAFGQEGLRDQMPGGILLDGIIPAVSRHQRYSVAHLYGSGARDPKNLSEVEKLFFGLHFLALHEAGREGAIEIESMRGKRELMVLTRAGGPVNGHVQDGLAVVDLATADDPGVSKKVFFEEVKRSLRRAADRILEANVEAIKGDHCDWCDYGELCRRSRAFGEEESPFGRDMVFEE